MKTIITIIIAGFFFSQSGLNIDPGQSQVEILGTSSLHDWESEVKKFTVSGKIEENQIINLKAAFEVESIKSGKSIMDDKTHNALKADDHPNIVFEAKSLEMKDKKVQGSGLLTIAGNTRSIQMNGDVEDSGSNTIIRGMTRLKMSDFGIDPPTAMFGTLTTGDEITVKYSIVLLN